MQIIAAESICSSILHIEEKLHQFLVQNSQKPVTGEEKKWDASERRQDIAEKTKKNYPGSRNHFPPKIVWRRYTVLWQRRRGSQAALCIQVQQTFFNSTDPQRSLLGPNPTTQSLPQTPLHPSITPPVPSMPTQAQHKHSRTIFGCINMSKKGH